MEEDEEVKISFDPPVLEAPPEGEASNGAVGAIFTEDSLAQLSSKLSIHEALSAVLTKDCPFKEFVQEILLSMMRVIKSEAGSFLEVNHEEKNIFFRCAVGTSSDRVTDFTIPFGQGVVGYVVESRLPHAVHDTKENKIHLKTIGAAVGFETHNLVAAPVIIRGKVFGVVELLNRVGEKNYTDQDIELLSYFCTAAARVIEARLMIAWARKAAAKAASGNSRGKAA